MSRENPRNVSHYLLVETKININKIDTISVTILTHSL